MARVVFDLDGTLVHTAPDIQGIANGLLAEADRPPLDLDETVAFVGNGIDAFVRHMRAARDLPETQQDYLREAFQARYAGAVHNSHPYDGVVAALDALAAAGHRLAICTNKPADPARALLAHLGLDARFAALVGGDSLPTKKPDPAPLAATLDALGDGPAVFLGDSEVDAETAARAGVPFLLFTEGYRKSSVADLPHTAAFTDWSDVPALVATHAA